MAFHNILFSKTSANSYNHALNQLNRGARKKRLNLYYCIFHLIKLSVPKRKNVFAKSCFFLLLTVGSICTAQEGKVSHNVPAVDFQVSYLCFGTVTHFTNTTTSSTALTYTWSIFEKDVAEPLLVTNAKDIVFKFPHKTSYTVELVAFNGHFSTLQRVFKMDSVTRANYEYTNCNSHFTNLSTCATSFFWDFGDGQSSTEKDPFHNYSITGGYTTKLVASNNTVIDSLKIGYYCYANNHNLTGGFTYRILEDSSSAEKDSTTVQFYINDSLIVIPATEFIWSWGDGTSTYLYSKPGWTPKHSYKKIGRDTTYTVFLLERVPCNEGFGQGDVFIPDSTAIVGTHLYPNPLGEENILRVESDQKKK